MMSLFRRGFMLVALLAVGISVFGQTLTQQGVTCRYNGAKPHTPLGNVYIKVGSAGNAVKSDSLTGKEMNVMFISYLDRLARQGVIPAKRRDDVEMLKKKLEERK